SSEALAVDKNGVRCLDQQLISVNFRFSFAQISFV
ncbi:MAG: hypothetical protein ACI91J_002797, partial [Yoonia sp.]